MKKIISVISIFTVLLILNSCSEDNSVTENKLQNQSISTLSKSSGPSANGQGILIIDGKKQTFSFHAREKDGLVEGSLEVKVRNEDFIARGEINCMVVDGNQATLSGVITKSNWDIPSEYSFFWFRVVDNGEGKNCPPDEFSNIYIPISYFPCDWEIPEGVEIPMIEIVSGNFQVKP